MGSAVDIAGVKPHCLTGAAAILITGERKKRDRLLDVGENRLHGDGGGGLRLIAAVCLHMSSSSSESELAPDRKMNKISPNSK